MLAALALITVSACLHAGWNLLAHGRRDGPALMLRVPFCVAAVGLAPALVAEVRAPILSPSLLGLLAITGAAQALYYLALARAYETSEFSLAYPLSRALPVLLLALVDLAGGRAPHALGLAGMTLIAAGCLLAPLPGLRAFTPRHYWNRATVWILALALATVVFTVVDKVALEHLPRSPAVAARYAVWEAVATVPWLWRLPTASVANIATRARTWLWVMLTAALSFASYGLVLLAYQLGERTSYVAAMRQVSIPLGVAASQLLLRERSTPLRTVAAVVVTAGVSLVLASR